jgi:UDP-N-acetylglucosamine 2-epimerase (non-hydrolysing)
MVRRELETSDVCWLRSEKNAHGAKFELKVSIVLGTRPEIIKMSPVIRECERLDLDYFIIHTGQHYSYNMDRVFFKQLRLPERARAATESRRPRCSSGWRRIFKTRSCPTSYWWRGRARILCVASLACLPEYVVAATCLELECGIAIAVGNEARAR